MSTQENGGPAFPPVHNPETHPSGMTLRDYFAAKAMQGLMAQSMGMALRHPEPAADYAYEVADAMLKEREL